ncbi:hypothetical protein BD626DRAFT_541387 [Schizophyllum amplum]|uniref:Uncharacterized protein n=1 Tax=Schizophyllum amplum TaxID=97359 RepID=A0A550BUT8_9AGAR|nr:hypothetical protein BD626DRAFT_541387 [Auriculariopsis ampla]
MSQAFFFTPHINLANNQPFSPVTRSTQFVNVMHGFSTHPIALRLTCLATRDRRGGDLGGVGHRARGITWNPKPKKQTNYLTHARTCYDPMPRWPFKSVSGSSLKSASTILGDALRPDKFIGEGTFAFDTRIEPLTFWYFRSVALDFLKFNINPREKYMPRACDLKLKLRPRVASKFNFRRYAFAIYLPLLFAASRRRAGRGGGYPEQRGSRFVDVLKRGDAAGLFPGRVRGAESALGDGETSPPSTSTIYVLLPMNVV